VEAVETKIREKVVGPGINDWDGHSISLEELNLGQAPFARAPARAAEHRRERSTAR
jgi:hypothetical protein